MIAILRGKMAVPIAIIIAVIILVAGISLVYFKISKGSSTPSGAFSCSGQIDDPTLRVKCNLKKIDVAGGLPKHLDDNAIDMVVGNMRQLGELRLALRQNKITEADYDSRYEILQNGCKLYSGLLCSEILMLQAPD